MDSIEREMNPVAKTVIIPDIIGEKTPNDAILDLFFSKK